MTLMNEIVEKRGGRLAGAPAGTVLGMLSVDLVPHPTAAEFCKYETRIRKWLLRETVIKFIVIYMRSTLFPYTILHIGFDNRSFRSLFGR